MNKFFVFLFLIIIFPDTAFSQNKFSLEQVINIALEQSPDAILAKHRFRSSYWQYRSFRANYLPGLTFSGTIPDLNRSFERITSDEGKEIFVERKSISNMANLSISQNIGLTGGRVFINSNLQRINQIGSEGTTQYLSTPVRVGFQQPIFAFNSLKWEKKIEPLAYEEAKKKLYRCCGVRIVKGYLPVFRPCQCPA
ncbi:MAG: TolC family protein [Bacteroidales bacterium]|nr:TolC family protein [Bacteroidales bacterium]